MPHENAPLSLAPPPHQVPAELWDRLAAGPCSPRCASSPAAEHAWIDLEALEAKGLSSGMVKVLDLYRGSRAKKRQSITNYFAPKAQ